MSWGFNTMIPVILPLFKSYTEKVRRKLFADSMHTVQCSQALDHFERNICKAPLSTLGIRVRDLDCMTVAEVFESHISLKMPLLALWYMAERYYGNLVRGFSTQWIPSTTSHCMHVLGNCGCHGSSINLPSLFRIWWERECGMRKRSDRLM